MVGAPLFLYGRDWRVTPLADGFRYEGPERTLDLPAPALTLGAAPDHQCGNRADHARHVGRLSGGRRRSSAGIDRRHVAGASATAGFRVRLPRSAARPGGNFGWTARTTIRAASLWVGRPPCGAPKKTGMPLDLIFGVRADKNPAEILTPLLPFAARLRAVAIPGDTMSLGAEEVAKAAYSGAGSDSDSFAAGFSGRRHRFPGRQSRTAADTDLRFALSGRRSLEREWDDDRLIRTAAPRRTPIEGKTGGEAAAATQRFSETYLLRREALEAVPDCAHRQRRRGGRPGSGNLFPPGS